MKLLDWEELDFFLRKANLIESGLESDCYLYDGNIYKIYSRNSKRNTLEYRERKYNKVCMLEKTLIEMPEFIIPNAIICDSKKNKQAVGVCLPYRPNSKNLWKYLENQSISRIKEYYKKYADIIGYLNTLGWFWGDATPYNVLVEPDGQLRLIDLDSAGYGQYKNDCTNKLTNRYLIETGIATYEQLRHYWCQNAKYDHLTVLLAYIYQVYKEEYIDVIKNMSFQDIFDKNEIKQVNLILEVERIL